VTDGIIRQMTATCSYINL